MNLVFPTSTPVAVAGTRAVAGPVRVPGAMHRVRSNGPFAWLNGRMSNVVDSSRGHLDLEPFWPSRQPHLFDQTCPGSPSASRHSAR